MLNIIKSMVEIKLIDGSGSGDGTSIGTVSGNGPGRIVKKFNKMLKL